MPELTTINVIDICGENRDLLREKEREGVVGLVDDAGIIHINALPSSEEQMVFIDQFCENEKLNTQHIKEVFQKEKYRAEHIIMFLIIALALIVAGYSFAPLFIASAIILPIIPVLLAGVAIIALTKFYLNLRLNSLETNKLQSKAFLDKIMTSKGSNMDESDINSENNGQTQEIKATIKAATDEATRVLSEKIEILSKNTQSFFSTFSKPSPEDPVNAFHHSERASSPSHS
ncbi:MAG: hypothetical protein E6K54_04060 [Gammaproteobacteria bacterium]|nr:MAG: hypothetical protein E6K54_04060 [Gammaproteobacteria bacterium]